MAEQIEDGTGKGYKVRVDEQNRLNVFSVTETILQKASDDGDSFNVNTGTINLTSASKSSLLYLKNNSDRNIVISTIGFLIGNSTGGSGDMLSEVIRNPRIGTIVTNSVPVDININKNFGSSKTLSADAYKGVEGDTIIDGEQAYTSLLASAGRAYTITTGSIVIPKGSSMGVNLTPQTGNTSMDVQIFLSLIEF